jgi:hypothetical protein
MQRLMVMCAICALLCGVFGLLACGGGGQETEQKTASELSDEIVVAEAEREKKDAKGEAEWGDVPIYSGASRHESEMVDQMTAAMSGMGDEAASEVRFFKTGDEFEKVVDYYQSEMPRQGWAMAVEKKDPGGWNSMWQKKGGHVLVSLTVVKDVEGECGIVIGRHLGRE